MSAAPPDRRMLIGWPADALILGIPTYKEIARFNPEAGFPVSGDALSRHSRATARQLPAPDVALTRSSAPSGRRAANTVPYAETFAERHRKAQAAIERNRLATGKARYRAHREPVSA